MFRTVLHRIVSIIIEIIVNTNEKSMNISNKNNILAGYYVTNRFEIHYKHIHTHVRFLTNALEEEI